MRIRGRNPSHTARTGPDNPPLSSIWSGEVAASFLTEPLPLRLTEIHFNPPGTPELEGNTLEFVELTNIGDREVDLTGVRFTRGITFTFAPTNAVTRLGPGERLVLVGNRDAFSAVNPDVTAIGGVFTGRLDNAGETVELLGPLDEVIASVPYRRTWVPLADGV